MNHVIRGWNDLKDYGIHVLTGEADGIGLRLLCDLDPKGHQLVSEFFGNTLARTIDVENNSNVIGAYVNGPSAFHKEEDQRAFLWCSVMLPRSVFNSLAVFCLLHHFDVALSSLDATETGWIAMGMSHAEWEEKGERLHNFHNGNFYYYEKSRHPGNGFRNQHQWTGRVE